MLMRTLWLLLLVLAGPAWGQIGPGGGGTVTSIATTSPITGGPITGSGTIGCATCAVAPGGAALPFGLSQAASNTVAPTPGTGWAPGDSLTFNVGTNTTAATGYVTATQVVTAAVAAGGSGGTNGACVVTGTAGGGPKASFAGTVSGGALTGPLTITSAGNYANNPTPLATSPVTGCGLTGATVNVTMGVYTWNVSTTGTYTSAPANPVANSATGGSGTGAAFNLSWAYQTSGMVVNTAGNANFNVLLSGGGQYLTGATENTFGGLFAGGNVSGGGNAAFGLNAMGIGGSSGAVNISNSAAFGKDCLRDVNGNNLTGLLCAGANALSSLNSNAYYLTAVGYNSQTNQLGTGGVNYSTSLGALSCPGAVAATFLNVDCFGGNTGGALTTAQYGLIIGTGNGNTNCAANVDFLLIGTGKSAIDCPDGTTGGIINIDGVITTTGKGTPSTSATTIAGSLTTGAAFTAGGKITFPTGLGAITQLAGPSDQALTVAATTPVQASATIAGNGVTIAGSGATAGSSSGGGAGGAVSLTGGNAAATGSASGVGGAINLTAGNGAGNSGTPSGGAVNITAGNAAGSVGGSTAGGAVTIMAGTSPSGNGTQTGGAVSLTSGAGSGGNPNTGGVGGANTVSTGAGGSSSANGSTGGASGALTISTGAGGNSTGASGTRTGGNSGSIVIGTGLPGTGASANGTAGTVTLQVGGTSALVAGAGGALTAPDLATVGTIAGSICATSGGLILYESGATGCTISLSRLKAHIQSLHDRDPLSMVLRLDPISHTMKDPAMFAHFPDEAKTRFGFTAEQVHSVNPSLSTFDGHGDLQAYDPNGILALTVAAVQAQQRTIRRLEWAACVLAILMLAYAGFNERRMRHRL